MMKRQGHLLLGTCWLPVPLGVLLFVSPWVLSAKIADLITPFGYPYEEHSVTTQDGYILTLQRIPTGRLKTHDGGTGRATHQQGGKSTIRGNGSHDRGDSEGNEFRPVVLLEHGVVDSAAGFLLQGPGKSLAFTLADEGMIVFTLAFTLADKGFDVWLANARGNTYSLGHAFLDPSSPQYWDFSLDEMARYDLPAQLDKIRDVTGQAQIASLGFSQGTTVTLAALASQQWLNSRFKVVVLMGPIAFCHYVAVQPLTILADLRVFQALPLLGVQGFLPSQPVLSALLGQLCLIVPDVCLFLLGALSGYSPGNVNASRFPTYLEYWPAGTSMHVAEHWAQLTRKPRPRMLTFFDYGSDCSAGQCNMVKYGAVLPPLYDLGNVRAPLVLVTGGKDRLADPTDVGDLRAALHHGVLVSEVHVERYEHMDFTWGQDAASTLYGRLAEELRRRT